MLHNQVNSRRRAVRVGIIIGSIAGALFAFQPNLHAQSSPLTVQPSTGRVGVGTTNPAAKLEARGTDIGISVMNNAGTQNYYFGIKDGDANKLYIGLGKDPSQGIPPAITVDTTSSVGIGTSSPGAKLHVQGSGNVRPRIATTDASPDALLEFYAPTTSRRSFVGWKNSADLPSSVGVYLWNVDNTPLYFGTTDVEQMRIQADGKVGIGTASPLAKLEVKGTDVGVSVMNNAATQNWYFGIKDSDSSKLYIGRGKDPSQGVPPAIIIDPTDKVGIGTTNPTRILTVPQNSATDPIADAWTTYSSRRWKTNIQEITGAVDKVQQLRGVSFDWKADGKHDIGLIAEEVGEVIPEVVSYEENGKDATSVDYARLVAVLIEAVKEQQVQISGLKSEVEGLKGKVRIAELPESAR